MATNALAYNGSPFYQRNSLISGKPAYSFGSFDSHNPSTRMQVTSVAITSDVATLAVKVVEGFAPVVGAFISVQGTKTATSGGAPNFNVTNVAISAVSGFNTGDNSTGTVSFALSSSNIATTADSGAAIVPSPELAQTIVEDTSYKQWVMPFPSNDANQGRTVTWQTDFTNCANAAAPDAISISLEGSQVDIDGEYEVLDTSTSTAGETRFVTGVNLPFLRITAGSITGTASGTGKIII